MSERYLIVGLGNPGKQYAQNRHNAGWMVLDELARRHGLNFDKTEKKALTASGQIGGRPVLLAKPQTYMNVSGEAVRGLVDFYKMDLARILLVHDDLDLPLGTLRLRKSGGAGGQNGMKSVIQHLGTRDFDRLRFGIGRPPGKMQPVDYVLQDFKGDDAILAREVADKAADAAEVWLREGIETAMTAFNGDVRQSTPEAAPDAEEILAKYLRAHELAPEDPGPMESLTGVLKNLGRLDEAVEWHLRTAALYEAQGSIGQAINQWEQAASLAPGRIDLQRQIAAAYLDLDNPKKSVQRLLILAQVLETRGQMADALAALEEALAINPQHPKAQRLYDQLRERQQG